MNSKAKLTELLPIPDCPCGRPAAFMIEVKADSGLYSPKCAEHVDCASEISARFTDEEVEAINQAADALDALWDLDAVRGKHDSRPGAEYHRLSLGHRLRAMLGEEEGEA